MGSVLGSAVFSNLDCTGAEGFWKTEGFGLIGRLICDAMLARVWPAMARGIESILKSRAQRIGRTRRFGERSGDGFAIEQANECADSGRIVVGKCPETGGSEGDIDVGCLSLMELVPIKSARR